MTKHYLKKFIKYVKESLLYRRRVKSTKRWKKKSLITTGEVILPVLLGFLLRIQSFNELKYKIKSNDFINIISKKMKLPQIDTIRETLKVIDFGFKILFSSIALLIELS